ncbi:MAG: hypothetical protein R3F65_01120 [bacterium]
MSDKTLVALYPTPRRARDAIRRLHEEQDVDFSRVSVIAHNAEGEFERITHEKPETRKEGNLAAEGAGAGATAGAVIGGVAGLLVGLGVFILPGVGAIVAAGPIGTTLAGAGIGAAAGGIIGALVGLGIPEKEAGYYAEGVRRGGVLLVVRTDEDKADGIADVLEDCDPLDLEEAARGWESEGWKGYDPKAEPYSDEKIRELRGRATGAGVGLDLGSTAATSRANTGVDRPTPMPGAGSGSSIPGTTGAAAARAAASPGTTGSAAADRRRVRRMDSPR